MLGLLSRDSAWSDCLTPLRAPTEQRHWLDSRQNKSNVQEETNVIIQLFLLMPLVRWSRKRPGRDRYR